MLSFCRVQTEISKTNPKHPQNNPYEAETKWGQSPKLMLVLGRVIPESGEPGTKPRAQSAMMCCK